jgi:carbon monoxide dehydrogenase subunit G
MPVTLFRAVTHVEAPPERVWALLRDLEGSSAWMVDATTVETLGPRSSGPGTRIRAVTRIAGLPLVDEMVVTGWEEGRLIQVRHLRWPIRGVAWFEVRPSATGGAWFEWAEELDPPLGPLGELGGRLLRGPIERVLRRSVARLKRLAERAPPPGSDRPGRRDAPGRRGGGGTAGGSRPRRSGGSGGGGSGRPSASPPPPSRGAG